MSTTPVKLSSNPCRQLYISHRLVVYTESEDDDDCIRCKNIRDGRFLLYLIPSVQDIQTYNITQKAIREFKAINDQVADEECELVHARLYEPASIEYLTRIGKLQDLRSLLKVMPNQKTLRPIPEKIPRFPTGGIMLQDLQALLRLPEKPIVPVEPPKKTKFKHAPRKFVLAKDRVLIYCKIFTSNIGDCNVESQLAANVTVAMEKIGATTWHSVYRVSRNGMGHMIVIFKWDKEKYPNMVKLMRCNKINKEQRDVIDRIDIPGGAHIRTGKVGTLEQFNDLHEKHFAHGTCYGTPFEWIGKKRVLAEHKPSLLLPPAPKA